eukprot:GHVP01016454.1.p1 GENE.GHVP01016454.1~~GHVP01016454.1.p1  ORF type:complete len:140 (-),score=25.81 GHVP01016454.1:334-732(-)
MKCREALNPGAFVFVYPESILPANPMEIVRNSSLKSFKHKGNEVFTKTTYDLQSNSTLFHFVDYSVPIDNDSYLYLRDPKHQNVFYELQESTKQIKDAIQLKLHQQQQQQQQIPLPSSEIPDSIDWDLPAIS